MGTRNLSVVSWPMVTAATAPPSMSFMSTLWHPCLMTAASSTSCARISKHSGPVTPLIGAHTWTAGVCGCSNAFATQPLRPLTCIRKWSGYMWPNGASGHDMDCPQVTLRPAQASLTFWLHVLLTPPLQAARGGSQALISRKRVAQGGRGSNLIRIPDGGLTQAAAEVGVVTDLEHLAVRAHAPPPPHARHVQLHLIPRERRELELLRADLVRRRPGWRRRERERRRQRWRRR